MDCPQCHGTGYLCDYCKCPMDYCQCPDEDDELFDEYGEDFDAGELQDDHDYNR